VDQHVRRAPHDRPEAVGRPAELLLQGDLLDRQIASLLLHEAKVLQRIAVDHDEIGDCAGRQDPEGPPIG
jgi:hypothetical protein